MNRRRRPRERRGWLLHRARRDFVRHRGAALALAAGLGLAALLLGAWRLADRIGNGVAPVLRDGVHVIAYLRDDAGAAKAAGLRDALARMAGVRAARLVTSAEALARLQDDLGPGGRVLDGVEEGFLPPSIEVALAAEPGAAELARDLAARLRALDGIAEVDTMDGVEHVVAWLSLARALSRVALTLAALAAAAAVVLAVRDGRRTRRIEGEVLAMLGETPGAARAPAGLAGAAVAFMGVTVGLAALLVVYLAARPALDAALRPLGVAPRFLVGPDLAAFALLAVVAGALAGWLSTRVPLTLDEARA